jgi:hypothetical protein
METGGDAKETTLKGCEAPLREQNNRGELKQMIRKGTEGLSVERGPEVAANEEFTGILNRRDTIVRDAGWDPFEVWRTRVRAPSKVTRARKDRPRDSRR